MRTFIILAIFLITAFGSITAEVPQMINYQGRLTDLAGDPVADGAYEIKFIVYGSPTGSDSLWSSGFQSVAVGDGFINYVLGSNVTMLPGLFAIGPARYLGITVGADPEISPRSQLLSVPYANQAHLADLAGFADDAQTLAGEDPDFYLSWGDMTNVPAGFADGVDNIDTDWNNLTNVPAGFADGTDNVGTGDITGVTAGSGLSGGGMSGNVSLSVPTNGITATHIATGAVGANEIADESITTADIENFSIYSADLSDGCVGSNKIADGTIADTDISNSAAISTSKISGTAVNLTDAQTITGQKTFAGSTTYFRDSSMIVNGFGVNIGSSFIPDASQLLSVRRDYSSFSARYGMRVILKNNVAGGVGEIIGIHSKVTSVVSNLGARYGVVGLAGDPANLNTSGSSHGVQGLAFGGQTGSSFGVTGYAEGSLVANYGGYFTQAKNGPGYAGYFNGDVGVSGFSATAGGGMKIDHPLDPTNQYLVHNSVQSPDMKTIYDGNITTDYGGTAVVQLPDYFEALNSSFTYQLTVIGDFGQAIIAKEVSNNSFTIRTENPNVKVSWMVTGIRKDAFANSQRTTVEIEKLEHEVGFYQNPDAYGMTETESINYIHEKDQKEEEAVR